MSLKNSLAQANEKRKYGKGKLICALLIAAILGLLFGVAVHAQAPAVSPFQGVGNVQFLDNNGVVLTSGVLYTYAAGTTTQLATYTDSTGLVQNPDPTPLTSGGRVTLWMLTSSLYKLVLCSQNDGASCAPSDVLFSVDNVPGGSTVAPISTANLLISGSPNPSTSGIVRLASGDTICWRNQANSGNLCFSKDSNDVLSWDSGAVKLPESATHTGTAGFDLLWADNTSHRLLMSNNGGSSAQVVGSGVDINTSDQVTQLHFGSSAAPIGSTLPTAGALLKWDGSNIVGASSTFVTTDQSTTGTGPVAVTGMSFSVLANTNYMVLCKIAHRESATQPIFQWTGPASPTAVVFSADSDNGDGGVTSFGTNIIPGGNSSAVTVVSLTLLLLNGPNAGTIQLEFANNTVGNTTTIKAGSACRIIQ